MRDILLTGIVFLTIPFIFKRPYIGVLVLAWLGYMNPHRMVWGFAYSLPFYAIITLVTFVAILMSRDIKKLPFQYFVLYVWVAWIAWMNITNPFALDAEAAYPEWQRAMKIQVISLLTIMLLQSKEKIILFIWVVVISIGYYGVKGGIFTALTFGNHIVFGPTGTYFTGNNALAIALLMIAPLMWFLHAQAESKLVRMLLVASIIFCMLAVIASYSRGAFLAFAVVMFYFFLKSRKKLAIIPIAMVSVVLLLSLMPDKYFDRLGTIQNYEEDRSAMGRINAWYFAINIAREHPLVGGGFGVFQPDLFFEYAPDPDDYHDAHSVYFQTLGEHGYVGFGLFLMLGLAGLRMNSLTIKKCRGQKDLLWVSVLAQMLYIGMVGYAVGGLFLSLAYFDLYYHLLALTVLIRLEADKQLKLVEDARHPVSSEVHTI